MLIQSSRPWPEEARRLPLARMIADPDIPVAVEASLMPPAFDAERLRLGLGTPVAPLRLSLSGALRGDGACRATRREPWARRRRSAPRAA